MNEEPRVNETAEHSDAEDQKQIEEPDQISGGSR